MNISNRIKKLQEKILSTAKKYHRNPNNILLVAVTKKQSEENMRIAYSAGIHDFAENYWQEAKIKIAKLHDLPLCWHFIGPIQSNKAKDLAKHFSWVHSVDRIKIANLLSRARPTHLAPLNVCVQVNLEDEKTKSGVSITQLMPLLQEINQLPNLKLCGFMALPAPQKDKTLQYQTFMRLKTLLDSMNQKLNLSMDTLSMGMSDDWEEAIAAGSSILRIGRAIFGERDMIR